VRAGEVEVSGFCSDDSAVKSVTVNDQPAAVRGSGWTAKVMVRAASGGKATPTRVTVVATDALGNSSEPLVRQLQVAMPFADRIGVDFEAVASAGTGFDGLPKRLRHRATGIEFVLIAPGAFDMGSPPGEAGRQEDETLHRVTLTEPFYLAETEVSVAQWRGYAQATGYKTEAEASGKGGYTHRFNAEGKGEYVQLTDAVWTNPLPYWTEKKNFQVDGTQPVTQISWNDAMSFCRHYKIQLPTEAQWEYACRGGQAARFWWGDVEEQGLGKVNGADRGGDSRVINFANKFDFDDGFQFTAPVNRNVTPNAFGLKDMLGNVWEWCADQADYIDGKAVTNTYDGAVTDPLCLSGARRVSRGGSWVSEPASCRSANRVCDDPSLADYGLGFRPALVARPPVK
jgi:formylglycine-generating enzyme required for sulfatase activity